MMTPTLYLAKGPLGACCVHECVVGKCVVTVLDVVVVVLGVVAGVAVGVHVVLLLILALRQFPSPHVRGAGNAAHWLLGLLTCHIVESLTCTCHLSASSSAAFERKRESFADVCQHRIYDKLGGAEGAGY